MKILRTVILLLIALSSLFAQEGSLLRIHAKIAPVLFFYDQLHREKMEDEKLFFYIVTNPASEENADIFRRFLMHRYQGDIKGYGFEVRMVALQDLDPKSVAGYPLYFMCGLEEEALHLKLKALEGSGSITIACNRSQLKEGALININIAREVELLLNTRVLRERNISFDASFIKLTKTVHE